MLYQELGHIKTPHKSGVSYHNGVLGEIRTPDRCLRRALLYPAELPGHQINYSIKIKENQALLVSISHNLATTIL